MSSYIWLGCFTLAAAYLWVCMCLHVWSVWICHSLPWPKDLRLTNTSVKVTGAAMMDFRAGQSADGHIIHFLLSDRWPLWFFVTGSWETLTPDRSTVQSSGSTKMTVWGLEWLVAIMGLRVLTTVKCVIEFIWCIHVPSVHRNTWCVMLCVEMCFEVHNNVQ